MANQCDRLFCLTLGYEHVPHELMIAGGGDATLRLPLTALLVHGPDGWFLFDSGPGEDVAGDPDLWGRWYKWGAPELNGGAPDVPASGDPVLEALERCGVGLNDLSALVMSHFHVDHTGGIPLFAGGPPVIVQKAELEFAFSPDAANATYYPSHYDNEQIRWQTIEGDCAIAAGIEAVFTPGHSAGHMSYMIEMADSGKWLFPFDALPTQENIDRNEPINTGSREEDAPQRRETHDRLMELYRSQEIRIVPGHCPRTWPRWKAPPEHYR